MRVGFTTVELLVVAAVTATLVAIAVPRFTWLRDSAQVHAATHDLVSTLGGARARAMGGRSRSAVHIDPRAGTVTVTQGADTLAWRSLGTLFGVTLRASRDSLAFDGRGLGVGAANTRVTIQRGNVTETVFVSRLGRVRH